MSFAHVSQLKDVEEQRNYHTSFVETCQKDGVILNGVEPQLLPGKGVGLVTNSRVTQDEVLIFVPASSLITIESRLFERQRELLKDLSVQGRLAALLVFAPILEVHVETTQRLWLSVLPSEADLKAALPMFWYFASRPLDAVQNAEQIPPQMAKMLRKQIARFQADLDVARKILFPLCMEQTSLASGKVEDLYKRGWLLVNTRSFYWDLAKPDTGRNKRRRDIRYNSTPLELSSNDCMALCPVIDYFNHANNEGCVVSFNAQGYTVKALRDHDAGEELTVSYGKHGNDYLLVEYGFALAENQSDSTTIDHIILRYFTDEQKLLLQEHNMLGEYVVSNRGESCHRTACALRLKVFKSVKRWIKYAEGRMEEESGCKEANKLLHDYLKLYVETHSTDQIEETIAHNFGRQTDERSPSEPVTHDTGTAGLLIERWREIYLMLEKTIRHLVAKEH